LPYNEREERYTLYAKPKRYRDMKKTVFRIERMDCPSEELMIRMKLQDVPGLTSLRFDTSGRSLEVRHTGDHHAIFSALDNLHLDTTFVSSESIDVTESDDDNRAQRIVLVQVLAINLFFFVLEMLAGFIAGSMGLVADSLDMLADSLVYGLSLFAVGRAVSRKKRIAGTAGYFQMVLAVLGFVEVIRRFLFNSEAPEFQVMIIISFLALLGNGICLYLLQRSKSREVHMQASMIFTSTDVVVNIGVIAAGVLVYLTSSRLPDLAVGTAVFLLVARGAYRILGLSRS
jgi:Co/Zn/Cd efflux system component